MQNCYPVRFSGPGLLLALPEIFSKQIINFEVDSKLCIDVDYDYICDFSPFGHSTPVNIPHIVCKISGRHERGQCMQKFELKKWTESEIVTQSLSDLEQLYQAIQDGETFILSCDGYAAVIIGSKLNNEIIESKVALCAEY